MQRLANMLRESAQMAFMSQATDFGQTSLQLAKADMGMTYAAVFQDHQKPTEPHRALVLVLSGTR